MLPANNPTATPKSPLLFASLDALEYSPLLFMAASSIVLSRIYKCHLSRCYGPDERTIFTAHSHQRGLINQRTSQIACQTFSITMANVIVIVCAFVMLSTIVSCSLTVNLKGVAH